MSVALVKDNIEKLKRDTELMLQLLDEHRVRMQSHDGRPIVYTPNPPHIVLADEDRQFIINTLNSFGGIIDETHTSLEKLGFKEIDEVMQNLAGNSTKAYETALRVTQGELTGDGFMWEPISDLKSSVLALEREFLISKSFRQLDNGARTYTLREMEARLRGTEEQKRNIRRQLYLKLDNDATQLEAQLLKPVNVDQLNLAVSKLLYLAGFDCEIYESIKADLDVLAVFPYGKIALLIETTTGNMPKNKIDQLVGRMQEYKKLLGTLLDADASVYLLAITCKDKSALDQTARREAMVNKVSTFTDIELKKLVDLLKKGKLSPDNLTELLQKSIPVS